mmetsp:Transcript_34002/g.100200  ORF Transcript_34002/g.100200 Transcript_34002/m.100200 type:complete len:225 (+) Transcript_34002:1412-2086(+)
MSMIVKPKIDIPLKNGAAAANGSVVISSTLLPVLIDVEPSLARFLVSGGNVSAKDREAVHEHTRSVGVGRFDGLPILVQLGVVLLDVEACDALEGLDPVEEGGVGGGDGIAYEVAIDLVLFGKLRFELPKEGLDLLAFGLFPLWIGIVLSEMSVVLLVDHCIIVARVKAAPAPMTQGIKCNGVGVDGKLDEIQNLLGRAGLLGKHQNDLIRLGVHLPVDGQNGH